MLYLILQVQPLVIQAHMVVMILLQKGPTIDDDDGLTASQEGAPASPQDTPNDDD
jgi:hypothetical protein